MSWEEAYKGYFRDVQHDTVDPKTERTDSTVKFCEICSSTWEPYYCLVSKRKSVAYHDKEIPSIGKDRKHCPRCTSKKASEIVKYQGV
tara:strand:+ start:510 stop:773 length:264 start_codon:yes stop_codon:yes gene_type:complete